MTLSGEQRACLAEGKGHTITSPGAYQEDYLKLVNKYPNIKHSDSKRPADEELPQGYRTIDRVGRGRVCVLEFLPGIDKPLKKDLESPEVLSNYFAETESTINLNQTRRLFLLETLDPNFVAILGKWLNVNPTVFIHHDRTGFWERMSNNGYSTGLPSLTRQGQGFTWDFWELRRIKGPLNYGWRTAHSFRHIAIFRISDVAEDVGRVHQKASYWATSRENGGWDALIVLDPPICEFIIEKNDGSFVAEAIQTQAYQGGYPDFIPFDNLDNTCCDSGPLRISLFDDICYYWETHGLFVTLDTNPLISTIWLQKIVASHYVLLVDFLAARHYHIEWLLTRQRTLSNFDLLWVERNWSELQAFSRRYSNYITHIELIMTSLGIGETHTIASRNWLSTDIDFVQIHKNMTRLERKCQTTIIAFSTLASLVTGHQGLEETKRSVSEAKSVKALTWLATLFIPLSFACGLFSMNDRYLPGTGSFWVYFSVSIPLVIATVSTITLFGRGYNKDDSWSFHTWCASFRVREPQEVP